MLTKSKLAIELSKLKTFNQPEIRLEQYPTDSETAAEILWKAYLNNDIKDKIMADLGSGTGILAYGCLRLEAKKVYLVEKDKQAEQIAKENLKQFKNALFINKDIKDFNQKVDITIQNPPFGTKTTHADSNFLEKAMHISEKIYSLHKTSTKEFIKQLAEKNNFKITEITDLKHPIKQIYPHHKKPLHQTKISCFILEKITHP